MLRQSLPSHARGSRGPIGPSLLIGIAIMTLLGGAGAGAAQPLAPDFGAVSDVLGGQRFLLRADDLVIGQILGFQKDLLLTSGLRVQSQSISTVVNGPCGGQVPQPPPFQTKVGRLFNLDHDVVVTLAPLSTAGPGCVGTPNMAFYVQDPRNAANNTQTSIAISPNTNRLALGDIDRDGYADVLLINDQAVIAYTALDPDNPSLGLREMGRASIGGSLAPQDDPATGDFNGDGALDVAWPTSTNRQNGPNWAVAFASVCPAAGAVVLGQTCAQAFQIVLSNQTLPFGDPSNDLTRYVALTAGNYASALTSAGVATSQLAIAWNALDSNGPRNVLAVYSFDAMLAPQLRSTLLFPYAGLFNFDQPTLASGKLAWFGETDQVVFTSTETGLVSVVTFDENLVMTAHSVGVPNPGQQDPFNFSVGVAVGRFDPPVVNGATNPNLQIARLGMLFDEFSPGATRVFLEVYTVDPASGFTPALASTFTVANQQLFPFDRDSDVLARYGNLLSAGDLQGRSLALGAPQKVTVTGSIQPQVVLGMPPMHVDFIQAAGSLPRGAPTVVNVNVMPSKYFSQYVTQQTESNQSANTNTTSYSVATKDTAGGKFSYGIPDIASVSAEVKAAVKQTHDNTVAKKFNTYASHQFDVSTQTGFSDQVWFTAKRFNIYVYRVLGRCVAAAGSSAAEGCPAGTAPLYVQFSGPDLVTPGRIDGSLLEWYQPVQEPGNVFSYPWSAALLQDLYAGFASLTADPATIWATDSSGSTVSVSWSQGSGSSVTSGTVSTQSFDVSTSITASVTAAGIGGSLSAGFDYNSSTSASTLNESSAKLGSSTGIKIVKPPFVNPGQYAYAAQTYIFGQQAPSGTEQQIPLGTVVTSAGPLWTAFVADPTDSDNGAGAWWRQAYTAPDVALNHPQRWTWTPPSGTQPDLIAFNDADPQAPLTTDFYFMKGLYITPASASGEGPQVQQVAKGDELRLTARVYNYSVVDMPTGSTVHVRFYGQPWNNTAHDFGGQAFVIDEVQLNPIPGFNSTSTNGQRPNWALASTTKLDTAAYADMYLVFWVVVWMEDNGTLVPEITGHGLTAIPGPTTAPTAVRIQPYSNNVGFYKQPVFICPNICAQPAGLGLRGDLGLDIKTVKIAPARVRQFETATVTATLAATDDARDGVLAVFYDGDPERGGQAFDAELIPHIRPRDVYVTQVRFRPHTCGAHTIFVAAETAMAASTLTVDCEAGGAGSVFTGKVERVGSGADDGKLTISGKVSTSGSADLRVATVTIANLLRDGSGRELVGGPGGAQFLPLALAPRRGGKATEAIFETPSGARPSARLEIKQRDGLEFTLKVERASILRPSPCGAAAGAATLGTSIVIAGNPPVPIELNPALTWRCSEDELKTP